MRLCAVILHKVLHDVGQARNLSRQSSARESPRTTVDIAAAIEAATLCGTAANSSGLWKLDADFYEVG